MPPFNGHPQGFSTAALELLDQGLNEIWHDMQVAAVAKTRPGAVPLMSTISARACAAVQENCLSDRQITRGSAPTRLPPPSRRA